MPSKIFSEYFSAASAVELKKDIDRFNLINVIESKRVMKNNEQSAFIFYYGRTVEFTELGISIANAGFQNSQLLNNAINTGLYKKIIIGNNPADVYLFSAPIKPNNCIIEFNCIVKTIDSVTDLLTADVFDNSFSFTVADGTKFHTGEQVIVTDDNAYLDPNIGGKKWGWGGTIVSIVGNVITLDTRNYSDFFVADNAYCATLQSTILFDTSNNSYIDFKGGYINNNKTGQVNIHPVYKAENLTIVEAYKQACGISGWKCNYTSISDSVIVRNASMHGVSFSSDYTAVMNTYIDIGDIHVYDSDEKGLHFKWTSDGKLGNAYIENCTHQDGIIFYSTNYDWEIGNIEIAGNIGRTGFDYNSTNAYFIVGDITVSGVCVAQGVDINSPEITISDIDLGSNTLRFQNGATVISDVIINSVVINNCVLGINDPIVLYDGPVTDIVIGSITINNSTGVGLQTINDGGVCSLCFVNGGGCFGHTGLKSDIAAGSDITLIGVW